MGDRTASARRVAYRRLARTTFLAALLILLAATFPAPIRTALQAATPGAIIVNTTVDEITSSDGLCSLREAIDNANSPGTDTTGGDCAVGTGTDTINFSVSGTITLGSGVPPIASGLPAIQNTLTIDGTGQAVTVDGASSFQVLEVGMGAAALTVNALTIAHGANGGGGIFNQGALTVTNCTFSGNSGGDFGGGIVNGGTLTVTNSTFSGNSAGEFGGGAIVNGNTATVTNSTFSGNSAGELGGGAIVNGKTLTVTNSTFSGNSSGEFGGGAIFNGSTLTVTNSTFSGNSASTGGGAIANLATLSVIGSTISGNSAGEFGGGIASSGTLTVTNSTFSGNSVSGKNAAGGGIGNAGTLTVTNCTLANNSALGGLGGGGIATIVGTVTVSNSILVDNTQNCGRIISTATIVNGGHNISDDGSCRFPTNFGANGKSIGDGVEPLLDPNGLQNNGGPTETIGLQSGSPAIDAIPIANCLSTDQRGLPRPDPKSPAEFACDIGAFESGNVAPATPVAQTATGTASPTPTPTPTSTPTETPTSTPTPAPVQATLNLSPNPLSFGRHKVGTTTTKSVKVQAPRSNRVPVVLESFSVSSATGDYSLDSVKTTCTQGESLSKSSCAIGIDFIPSVKTKGLGDLGQLQVQTNAKVIKPKNGVVKLTGGGK